MDIEKLRKITGDDWVVTDREKMLDYMRDAVFDSVLPSPAENVVLVKPANSVEISEILKLANE